MKPKIHHIGGVMVILTLWGPAAAAQVSADVHSAHAGQTGSPREIGRTTERELKVVLSSTFGSVAVRSGEPEKIVIVRGASGDPDFRTSIDYAVRNRVGYLDLKLGEPEGGSQRNGASFNVTRLGQGSWELLFNDAIPISFDIELGVGKGRFDFSGLNVRDFNLSAGASDVRVTFNRPNLSEIDNITIESGVSKFEGRNLGNANFKRLRFQGGVGAYVLDFSGELDREVDVDAEVGLGILTLIVPPAVGARVLYEKNWVSELEVPADFTTSTDNVYTSANYVSARGRMNIRVDSGLGSIRIRRP